MHTTLHDTHYTTRNHLTRSDKTPCNAKHTTHTKHTPPHITYHTHHTAHAMLNTHIAPHGGGNCRSRNKKQSLGEIVFVVLRVKKFLCCKVQQSTDFATLAVSWSTTKERLQRAQNPYHIGLPNRGLGWVGLDSPDLKTRQTREKFWVPQERRKRYPSGGVQGGSHPHLNPVHKVGKTQMPTCKLASLKWLNNPNSCQNAQCKICLVGAPNRAGGGGGST